MDEKLEFEKERWRTELELREQELGLKQHEQRNRDAELELKQREQRRLTWRSPLAVAIFAAAVAAGGNALVSVLNAQTQLQLENSKADSSRILEMIKTGDPDKAASNLQFLLDLELISDPDRAQKLTASLQKRSPGSGPSLPSATQSFGFEPTELLTAPLRDNLQGLLERYVAYIADIGFPKTTERVNIRIDNMSGGVNAYYDASDNSIVIHPQMAADQSVPLREYNHHLLLVGTNQPGWFGQYAAIESALADYFATSFLDNPRLGEIAAKAIDPKLPFIRNLSNERKFGEFSGIANDSNFQYAGAEIWGGAFWEIRSALSRGKVDPLLVEAWQKTVWTGGENLRVSSFLQSLRSTARTRLSAADAERIMSVFRARGFPVPG